MGMKIAVVGGGSTYTPELIEGIARRHDRLPVDELVLLDLDAERLDRRRPGSADARAPRLAGRLIRDRRPRRGDRRRRLRARPAARRRPGGAPRRRDAASAGSARSARRRPAPAASPRRCGPCRSSRPRRAGGRARRARTRGSSTSPTRSGSSPRRCSTTGHRAIGLCNVAIGLQRRFAARFGVEPERGRARARRPEPPDVGARASGSTASTGCPSCSTRRRGLAEMVGMPVELVRALGALPVVLPSLLLPHSTRSSREQQRRAHAGQGGDGHRDAAARAVQGPDPRHEAGAARATAAAPSTARRPRS